MGSQIDTGHQLTERTEADRRAPRRSLVWWVAAAGAAAGIASLAYRRKQSRWQVAKKQAVRLAEGAAKEWKPLAGGAAVAGAAIVAYNRRAHRPDRWHRVMNRAGRMAQDMEIKPWMRMAATTAVALGSAYRLRGRSAGRRMPSEAAVEKVTAGALRLVNRAKRVSRETAKLYPQVRKAFA